MGSMASMMYQLRMYMVPSTMAARLGGFMTQNASERAAQKVLVFDFGAQYAQLIARRVRDLHVYSEIVPCDITADEVREMAPSALIQIGRAHV